MFVIDGREIGPSAPPYVIAELSANHNGDFDRAVAIMRAAKAAGADAIKLQTYTADSLTIDAGSDDFVVKGGLWDGETLHALYRRAAMPWEWHEPLFRAGRDIGLTVFSSAFDKAGADLLEQLDCPAYKIASFEAVDLPLIDYVARKGKPIIASTGLCSLSDIEQVAATIRATGNNNFALLHCISAYPAPTSGFNLRCIPHLRENFGIPIGLSDHSIGSAIAVAAVSLGANIIEKHVTLSRSDGGPDAPFSAEPDELAQLINDTQAAWRGLGEADYTRTAEERQNMRFRRSLYAIADIKAGEILSEANIRSIRPAFGLQPKEFPKILGHKARAPIARGTPLSWDLID